jgi:hypothetical protein
MKRSLGLHCSILRINSVATENDISLGKSSWISAGEELEYLANPTEPPRISPADKESLERFVRVLVTQSIVPHMERCISMWNDQVWISEYTDIDRIIQTRNSREGIHCLPSSIRNLLPKCNANNRNRKLRHLNLFLSSLNPRSSNAKTSRLRLYAARL